jgi:hypothetical protein
VILPGASAVLFNRNPRAVHHVEGVHARPCAREILGTNALETDEFIHRDVFNLDAPASRSQVD